MKRRVGKQEIVAVVLILGSSVLYWHRPAQPGIVFASDAAPAAAQEVPDDR